MESGRGLPASRVAAPRAGVAVYGDDDADIASYDMVVFVVRRRSGGGIWACELSSFLEGSLKEIGAVRPRILFALRATISVSAKCYPLSKIDS